MTGDRYLATGLVNRTQSNWISIELNRTQSNSIRGLSSIEFGNRTKSNSHKNCTIELNRTFDFRTFDFCTTQWCWKSTSSWSYFGIPGSIARVFRKRINSREMASDAPWVVSFKCVVKGYQDCRFDMKEGEDQSFKENKRAVARKAVHVFRIVNKRGQLDHLTGGPSRGYERLKNYV